MAIICNLKEILNKRGITIAELAKIVGITQANMSNIVNRKTASIGYNTLGKICEYLNLQPGDIFEYKIVKKRRVIPLFLDYTGTTDNLLKQGSENVKDFFSAIIELEVRSNCNVQITMVTGSSLESAKHKYKLNGNIKLLLSIIKLFLDLFIFIPSNSIPSIFASSIYSFSFSLDLFILSKFLIKYFV